MPPIKDVDTLFTAARSRGIRSLVALQSYGQLEQKYNRNKARIIKDSCQIIIYTFVGPAARDTSEEFSKALGTRTVQSGSVSRSDRGSSTTFNMVSKPLLSPDEIVHMKRGQFVIMKAGCFPILSNLPNYRDYLPPMKPYVSARDRNEIIKIQFLTGDKIRGQTTSAKYVLMPGMFD